MSESLVLPNIIWRIENARSLRKKWSPTFTFLGEKWKLKFTRFDYSDREQFQIFLHKLTSLTQKHDVTLQLTSNLMQPDGQFSLILQYYREFNYFLSDEWCIWFFSNLTVTSDYPGDISNMRFFCSFKLLKGGETVLGDNNKIDLNATKDSPCSYRLCQDFVPMFNNEFLSDVTFVCGDQTFHAHRAILSARSEVFADMFKSDMKKSKFDIEDTEPTTLKQMMCYMYSGEISDLTVANVRNIYLAADTYKLESLKNKCMLMVENLCNKVPETEEEAVEAVIGRAEVADAAGVADAAESGTVISEKCDGNIKKNDPTYYFADIQAVLCSDEWKNLSKNHPEMAKEAFQYFIIGSPCEISE